MKDLESLVQFRSEQLAYLVLTRRNDLAITRKQRLGGLQIDLAATILEDGVETAQLFAIETKGVRSRSELRKVKNSDYGVYSLPFPFLLFIFNMENDEGYWRWIVEPVPDSDALPGAVRSAQEDFEPLTNEAVGDIVDRVRHWYAARLTKR